MSDGRNPYGRRGGYTDRAGGEYEHDAAMGFSYRDGARGSYGGRDHTYSQSDSARYGRDYEHGMGSDGNYGYDGFDGRGGSYGGNDQMMFNPYAPMHDGHMAKLTQKDIKKWEKKLENADGTRGGKYETQQLMPLVERLGVRFEEYTPELFTAVVNMMYSDYCKVLGADPMMYIKLAKAFLEDDDFSGEPAEKAALYYKCIVEKDD